jgi:tripeptidyl-peptidase-1
VSTSPIVEMKSVITFVVTSLVAFTSAFPSSSYVVHEKRDHSVHEKWIRTEDKISSDVIIPLSISLTQQNLDKGYDFLMDVSDPVSPNYGKHWSLEKVVFKFHA